MTKNEIQNNIQNVNNQLAALNSEKNILEQKQQLLYDFSLKCNSKADAFSNSIARRKNKLSSIESIADRVKLAFSYHDKMNDLLTGSPYNKAYNSIVDILNTTIDLKTQVERELQDVINQIQSLNNQLSNLQYLYNTYPEEES